MISEECRARAAEVRGWGSKHPQFAKAAEDIAEQWEAVALEVEEAMRVPRGASLKSES